MYQKLSFIFNQKQKKELAALIVVVITGSILEMLGVSSILPIIYIIIDENAVNKNIFLNKIYTIGKFDNITEFTVILIVFIILLYVIKNLFLGFRDYFKFSFVNNTQKEIATRMMDCYIKQPYLFHTQNNSATIQRNIINDTGTFIACVLALLDVLVNGTLSIALIITLLLTDAAITAILLVVLGGAGVVFLKPFSKRLNKYGDDSRMCGEKMIKWINQSMGGIKEIKILGKEAFFEDKFTVEFGKSSHAQKMSQFMGCVPGLTMEAICIATILSIVVIKVIQGGDITSLIPTLSVVVLAGMKLLSAFTALMAQISRVFYTRPAMDATYNDLRELEKLREAKQTITTKRRLNLQKEIFVDNITFQYPNVGKPVLRGVSLRIKRGSSVALIGASGMGKTTLADLILGILEPLDGKIIADGSINMENDLASWHTMFGYIPQNIYLLDDTIKNNITFGIAKEDIDERALWDAIEEAQLKDFIDSLEEGIDTQIGEWGTRLSGGQRQRIGIARALYLKPSVLVLDEATSALDNETEQAVMEAIDNLHGKLTMLIIAHRLTTIKNCDYVYEVTEGKVVEQHKS